MGSVTDFLFNGTPPPSITTYNTATQNIPTWLSDATLGLVNKANSIAGMDYPMYNGPRIAGQTNDQLAGQDLVRNTANRYTPAAEGALSSTANVMNTVSPYFDAASGQFNQAGQTLGGVTAGAQPGYDAAMGQFGDASAGYAGSVAPGKGGLSAAMPWLVGASGSYTGNTVNDYMNPYIGNVIDQATWDANRNFNNNIMPGLKDMFTSNGQYGSSAHESAANTAATDLTTGLQKGALGALAGAYDSGRTAFNADQSRYAGLASTAGQFGSDQQRAEQAAATGQANIGNDITNTTTAQGDLALRTAGAEGTLGQNIGALGTNVASTDMASANQQAQIAAQLQKMGLTGASALATSGADQQAQTQKSLDTAYSDFMNQSNWGKTQADWLSTIIRGLPTSYSATSSSTAPLSGSSYGASPANSLAGLITALYGTTKARGGIVRPRTVPRGALALLGA